MAERTSAWSLFGWASLGKHTEEQVYTVVAELERHVQPIVSHFSPPYICVYVYINMYNQTSRSSWDMIGHFRLSSKASEAAYSYLEQHAHQIHLQYCWHTLFALHIAHAFKFNGWLLILYLPFWPLITQTLSTTLGDLPACGAQLLHVRI